MKKRKRISIKKNARKREQNTFKRQKKNMDIKKISGLFCFLMQKQAAAHNFIKVTSR